MEVVYSKNGIPIRLTDERWLHISTAHGEIAEFYFEILETVSDPDLIYKGKEDELLGIKEIEKGKFLVVIYKEINGEDGFIITAFLTNRIDRFQRRKKVWSQ